MRLPLCALLVLAACRPPGYGKDEVNVDAAPGVDAGTDAGADAAAATCDRLFRLEGQGGANTVYLTGDFVSWGGNPGAGAIPMVRGGDGAWTAMRTFPAGTHLYKFIVNESMWIHDPANPQRVDDGFGGFNSVYTCAP